MKKPSDFFNRSNTIDENAQIDRNQTNDYLEPLRAISRSLYTCIYVIDYQKRGFEYVSNNPLFLCGNTAEEVQQMGYEYYFKYVPEEDLQLLLKINEAGFQFYDNLPIEDRKLYSITYDFHIKNPDGNLVLINHKLTPLFLTASGKLWKALCIVTLSSERNAGNVKVFKQGENIVYTYSLKDNYWKSYPRIKISDREKEILTLAARGFTINQISDAIFVSPDTVKFHRRKVFDKLEVTNISEAIFFTINNKLI